MYNQYVCHTFRAHTTLSWLSYSQLRIPVVSDLPHVRAQSNAARCIITRRIRFCSQQLLGFVGFNFADVRTYRLSADMYRVRS